MPPANAAARRKLHYTSLDDLQSDAERLAKGEFRTVGQWSYPQILDHLARTMTASLDGFGFKAPWWARTFIAPLAKNSFLTKPMRAGFKLPKSATALAPSADVSLSAAMENLRKAMTRCTGETPQAEHPFLGKLASQEWNALYLRHAELHMSFVIPAKD
jgi:hypothetical protein